MIQINPGGIRRREPAPGLIFPTTARTMIPLQSKNMSRERHRK